MGLGGVSTPKAPVAVNTDIKSVKSFGPGWLILIRQDGVQVKRSQGTVSWRCNNPGNVKEGPFSRQYGSVGRDYGGHAVFPTTAQGRKAKEQLLFGTDRNYYKMNIREAMAVYAPVNDKAAHNDPVAYANFIVKRSQISPSAELQDLTAEQRIKVIDAMSVYEGFKVGVEEKL